MVEGRHIRVDDGFGVDGWCCSCKDVRSAEKVSVWRSKIETRTIRGRYSSRGLYGRTGTENWAGEGDEAGTEREIGECERCERREDTITSQGST